MSDDLLTTIRFEVDASGVTNGLTSVKRSISDLGTEVKKITDKTNEALSKVGTGDLPVSKGLEKTSKTIIKQTGELEKAIATFGSAASTSLKQAFKSMAAEEVRLRGMGIDPAIMNPYLEKLKEAQKLTAAMAAQERKLQESAQATAAAQAQEAEKAARALKEQTAALQAFKTEVQNAELNLTHFGRAKTAAFLEDKGRRLGFDPAMVQAELAGLKKIEDANKAAFAAANPHIAELAKRAEAAGTSVKGLTANLRNVPAQLTDIVISLQGGQAPLTVLLQQGGQLKDMFGGIGNAARALGGYVASLINPFSLAAGAVGTLGYAYFAGSKELDEYRKALVLTGNSVGLTSGQMQDMARSMAAVGGTQTAASNALVAFVNAGASGSDSLQKFAQSALNFSKVTGQAVEDIAKQFADLGKNPLEASVKLNESTNFLTMSLYEQIKALEEQGKKTEAANVSQQAYSDTLNQNTAQITANLGTIEKGWNAIASATKGAWDWMKNVGRADSSDQTIAKLKAEIASRDAIINAPQARDWAKNEANKGLQQLRDKLDELQKTAALSQIRASDRGIEAQAVKDKIEWDKTHQSQLDKLQQSLHKEVEDYAKLKAAGKDDAATRLQYEQRIHHLVKQEADYLKGEYKTELKTQKPKAESIDAFGKELTATKQWLATKERMIHDSYSTQQKSIEDAYKNQEISAAQFYTRQLANDEKALSDSEKVRAEAQARFDIEMAKRVSETKARPAGNDRTTALRDLAAEAQNFAESQKAARQKELNDMATHSDAMAREIEKQAQKVTESADTYIADMKRKAQADAALLAAREAMAGQAPEIIAGMEAELKVRADATKILEQTAQEYAKAAEEARTFEDALASNFADGKEATNAEILLLETLQSAAKSSRKALVELGGAVDSSALEAGITATDASIKKQTEEVAKEVQKTLADGILSAGKDGGAGLRKALEDVLVTKPFRIVVEAMLQPVSTAIAQGIMGQSIGGSVAGATGFQTAMNAASLAVSTFGSNALEAAKAVTIEGASFGEVVSTISSELASGKLAAGIGGAVGAAAPFAIAAVAAQSLFNAMQGSVTPTGTFLYGGQGRFGGRQDFAQSGGFLGGGNTKNSSWFDPAPAVAKYMSAIEGAITSSIKDTAKAIGLSTDAIDGYNKQIEVSIGGLDGQQTKAAIDKAFVGMADDMVESLFGGMILPLSKSGETASQTMNRLVSDLQAVNGVLSDLNKPLMDMSLSGAEATEALLKSVGGLDKFKELATSLTTVNERLSQLGLPLLDVSVAGAQAAQNLLKATEDALKAKEAADKLQSETDNFSMALLTANGKSTTSILQAIADRTMASVKASMPSIGDWASLSRITPEQYAGYSDADRAKLNAAVTAHNNLSNALDTSSKSAESAAKSAKDAAETAAKAYSDALQSVQDDTRDTLAQTADIGKTEFQKQLAQIQRDGAKKQAEIDKLSSASDKAAKEYADLTKAASDSSKAITTLADVFDTASAGAKALGGTASKMIADIADSLAKAGVKTPAQNQANALAMTVVRASTGGSIKGQGTSTSDSIPAMLSNGEYVIKASSAAKLGTQFLDALNAGGMQATVFRADGGAVGFNPHDQKSIIDTWVGALNWSADAMLSSALTLQAVAEDNGITVAQLKEFGYSLDNFSDDTKALIQANVSPKSWAWANGAISESGGQPFIPTGGISTTTATVAAGGSSVVADNTAVKLAAAYEAQRTSMLELYKSTQTQTEANNKLAAAGYDVSGLSADGIKRYFAGLLDAAKPLADGSFSDSAKTAIAQIDALGTSISTLTKVAEDRQTWQDKLDVLTGKSTERQQALQRDLASTTDAVTKALISQIYAQEDAKTATEKSAAAAESTAKENATWQDKIDVLTKASTQREIEQRNALNEATDASTKALINQYYAQVDLSEALAQVTALADSAASTLKGQQTDAARLNVDYLTTSGDTVGAAAAQKAIDLADVYTALDEATKKLSTATDAEVQSKLQSAITSGRATIALYETNKRREAEIETLKKYQSAAQNAQSALASSADMLANSRVSLLEAQGDTAGARALRRSMDIKPYLDAITEATTGLATATTQAQKDLLNLVISTSNQSIANYDLSKSLDQQAQEAQAARAAAESLGASYADLSNQIQDANVALARASGMDAYADDLQTAIDLRGHAGDAYYESLYREVQTIRKLTDARQQLNDINASIEQTETKLLRARSADFKDNVIANNRDRSVELSAILRPVASAQNELARSNISWQDFLTSRGIASIHGYGTKLLSTSLANDASFENRQRMLIEDWNYRIDDAVKTDGTFVNGGALQALRDFAAMGRTTSQQTKLQSIVSSGQDIVDAYNRNKSREAELKIIELQDEAYKNSLDAQKAVLDAQKAYADVLKSTISTMQDFIATLDGASTPTQNLANARLNFQAVAARAGSGDTSAYKDLTPAARAFLDLSKGYSKSIQDYRRDEAAVRNTLNAVIRVNQNELGKLPAEIARAAEPTKDAWLKLQEATKKETETSFMLTALQVDKAASTRRLRTAEETLSDRYVEAVYQLDADKRTSYLQVIQDAVNAKVEDATLPDFSAAFSFGDVWTTAINNTLPEPVTNAQLNAIIAQKFPGLEPSDFVSSLTASQLSSLVSGKLPILTKENLVGVPANMVDLVNAKLTQLLPKDFAGSSFDFKAMVQAAINSVMASVSKPNVAQDAASTATNFVQQQGLIGGTSGTGVSTVTPQTNQDRYDAALADLANNPAATGAWVNNILGQYASLTPRSGTVADYLRQRISNPSPHTYDWLWESAAYAKSIGKTESDLLQALNAIAGFGDTTTADRLRSILNMVGIPQFATGTNNVPYDMTARIHKGEAIIPAAFNPERYSKASGNTALIAEIKALRAEVSRLREEQKAGQNAIAANTRRTAQALIKFDTDGLPETRT